MKNAIITRTKNKQFHFSLTGNNNKVIASSETYVRKGSAVKTIKKYFPGFIIRDLTMIIVLMLSTVIAFGQVQPATLDGSKSSDPDGQIAGYKWAQVGTTPSTCVITNATSAIATAVPAGGVQWTPGVYTFQLTVTDNLGATSSATVRVTIVSNPPTVDAGNNQTIQLPASSVALKATATATLGIVKVWAWTQSAGPSTAVFNRRDTSAVTVSGLIAGAYTFRVNVTDNYGATAVDSVMITVTPANQVPKADAGADKTITLPVNSVALGGSDLPFGATVAWTKLSGGNAVILSPFQSTTTVNGLQAGKYVFEKKVTVNGVSALDEVIVTVKKKCCWICHLFRAC